MTAKKPKSKTELGAEAEQVVANYLTRHNCRILATNWRCRRGELDIICLDGDCLVFVEVKSVGKPTRWNPVERIDRRKRRRMSLAALDYLSRNEGKWDGVRFDAVIARRCGDAEWKIEHLKDAFQIEADDELS